MLAAKPSVICLLWLFLASTQATTAQSLEQRALNESGKNDLSLVTCSENPPSSRVARTPVLISPDGKRAYAEVEALAIEPTEETKLDWPWCSNKSKLFVASAREESYDLVFLEEPRRWQLGNGMKLIDWSADGRYLLVELWIWQYNSDAMGNYVLIYDSQSTTFYTPDHNKIFSRTLGKECYLNLAVAGFSHDGKVVLEAEDDAMLGSACLEKKTLWLLDPLRESVEPKPEDYKMKQYGRFEAQKPQD